LSTAARILIVDDDPIVSDSLSEFLSREGYTTVTATDGAEAMDMLNAAATDRNGNSLAAVGLVVADLNMPRCDGLELMKKIRKEHASIAVIVISTLLNAAYFVPVIYVAFFNAPPEQEGEAPHGEAPLPIVIALTATAAGTVALFFFPDMALDLAIRVGEVSR